MRVEEWWMRHPDTYDFYMFWDEYHFGDYHSEYDTECVDRRAEGYCMDFSFTDDEECEWQLEYNSCPEREQFQCWNF